MIRKKGLSSVVATVSLILLTFAAVGIIAEYIIPLVKDNLSDGGECLNYRDYFSFRDELGYNCGKNGLYSVSVGASPAGGETGKKINGFVLVFIEETGDSSDVEVSIGSSDFGMDEGMIRRVNTSLKLDVPKSGEVRTYVYNSSKRFISVEIYPKLMSDRLCSLTDSIKIEDVVCANILTVE